MFAKIPFNNYFIVSSKQATCDVHVMSKQLTVSVFSLFYYLFACFQEESEEIWRELLHGNFQTVLMSKTLLQSKYRLLCYNCAEIVCSVGIVFFIYFIHIAAIIQSHVFNSHG